MAERISSTRKSAERNAFTMNEFMVHATFHQQDQQNILEHIPQEREHIKLLTEQGVIEALFIASDFSGVWLVVQGESQARKRHILSPE